MKGADQPAHLQSVQHLFINAVVGMVAKLATFKISRFQLVAVAEQAGSSLILSQNTEDGFLVPGRPMSHRDNQPRLRLA